MLFCYRHIAELIQDGQQQLTEPANATTELNETTNNDPSPAAEGGAEEGFEAPAPAEASAEKPED